MRGNLIGTWGVQSLDFAQEPRQDHQPAKKQRPAGSEAGAPAKPAPRSQKEHPQVAENAFGGFCEYLVIALVSRGGGPGGIAPVGENTFRCFCEILDIALLALGGGVRLASLRSGVLVSGLFGVQRGPVLNGRRLVNFANPWLLQLSWFQGFCCLSLAPGMATARVRDHHFDFRTCSLFSLKRRVGEEMRGNLIGTWGV